MDLKKIKFVKKENEYDDVFTFFFDKSDVNYEAGQYAHILAIGEEREVRELSFASTPSENELMFTMHTDTNSAFKNTMHNLSEGEEVFLFKIKGKLEFPVANETDYVFLSGGVGITPYRSILKEHANPNLNIKLAQVQRDNYLFKNELDSLVNEYIEIHPDNFRNDILNVINSNKDSLFYVCGSKRFIDGVVELFEESNISESRIQIESFTKEKKKHVASQSSCGCGCSCGSGAPSANSGSSCNC